MLLINQKLVGKMAIKNLSVSGILRGLSLLAMMGLLAGCVSGGGSGAAGNVAPASGGGGGSVPATSSGSFSVSWSAPQTRADGSPISLSEIDGYRIYYGSAPGNYQESVDVTNGSATSVNVIDVPAGDYYVVITTYDSAGRESAQSGAILKQAS